MSAGVTETLEFDASAAESAVDQLGQELLDVASLFRDGIEEALAQLATITIGDVDATSVVTAVEDAIAASEADPVMIDADASAVPGEITAAVEEAGGAVVPVEADTQSAMSEANQLVAEIDGLDATVSVKADTAEAEESLSGLTDSTDKLGSSSSTAAGHQSELVESSGLLAGAAALGRGEVGGLSEGATGLGLNSAGAVAGVAALAATAHELYTEGVQATGAEERFNTVLGETASKVETVNVGDLSIDLDKLGLAFGSTDAEMKNSSASVFQFATNAGYSSDEAATFTSNIEALSARAVSLNPNLGTLSDVTDSLATRIARGGRFAATFGLALTANEIAARASINTGKENAADLTIQEKAYAAAQIAVERYGSGLDSTVQGGMQNAINQDKALRAEMKETIEEAGKQVVLPLFEAFRAAIPIVGQLAGVVGGLAGEVLPPLAAILRVLGPLIPPITYALLAFYLANTILPAAMGLVTTALTSLGVVAPVTAGAVTVASVEIEAATAAVEAAAGPIGWIALGLSVAATAFGIFGGGAEDSTAKVDAFNSALEESNGKLDEAAVKAARALLEERHQMDDLANAGVKLDDVLALTNVTTDKQNDALQRATAAAALHGSVTKDMIASIAASDPAMARLLYQLEREGTLNPGLIATIASLSNSHRDNAETLKNRTAAGAADNQIMQDATTDADNEAAARQKATDSVNAYTQALQDLVGGQLGVTEAQLRMIDTQQRTADAFAQQVDDTHNATEVDTARTESLVGQVHAAEDLATAIYKQTYATQGADAATAAANGTMSTFASTLRDQLITQFGLTGEAADGMLAKLGLIQYTTPPQADALAALGQIAREYGITSDSTATEVAAAFGRMQADTEAKTAAAAAATAAGGEQIKGNLTDAGAGGAAGFANGIAPMPGTASDTVLNSVNAAALAGANAHNVGYGIGASLSAGIGDGIIANDGYVTAQAEQVISNAESAARAKAESKSPSKLFARLGGDLTLGMAEGIAGEAEAAMRAQRSLIGDLAGAASAGGGGVGRVSVSVPVSMNVHGGTGDRGAMRAAGQDLGQTVAATTIETVLGALG